MEVYLSVVKQSESWLEHSRGVASASGRRMGLMLVPLLLIAGACGAPDGPLAPDNLRQTFADGSMVATLSHNNHQYTLDLEARELRDASGRIIELTVAQAAEVAQMYDEIRYAEYIDGEFASTPFPEQPMCGNNPCQPELREAPVPPLARRGVSARTPHVFLGGRIRMWENRPLGRGRPSTAPFSLLGSVDPAVESAPATFNYQDPPSCWHIAMAIYSLRLELVSAKDVAVDALSSLFSLGLEDGKLRGSVSHPLWIGAGITVAAAEQSVRSLALEGMASRYSAASCWTRQWDNRQSHGTIVSMPGTGTSGGGGWKKTCTVGTVVLEIDGVFYEYEANFCTIEFEE